MKIQVKFPDRDWFDLDENLAGVTTSDHPHSGSMRVKNIFSVNVGTDGLLIVADPVEELVAAQPEPLVVIDEVPAPVKLDDDIPF